MSILDLPVIVAALDATATATGDPAAAQQIVEPMFVKILATTLFAIAVIHTFAVKKFARMAHHYPQGSLQENLLHFLAETEIVFGLWASVMFLAYAAAHRSIHHAVVYIETQLTFTEPKFVLVVMVVAATRPVVQLAERLILSVARLLPLKENVSFYIATLAFGSLLGSFITEPAAMTLLAMLLKQRYFDRGISSSLAYATIGLLFVNVSIGGTLTHFAAPPVLMVASKWKWGFWHMLTNFGWRSAAACLTSTLVVTAVYFKQLNNLQPPTESRQFIPAWLTGAHVTCLAAVVYFAHYPDVFFGVFMLFLGLVTATREYQEALKLKEGLLVGFFLAGLVVFSELQAWWLEPLIQNMSSSMLYYGATALTAITDNAALTLLGSQVPNLSDDLKFALLAGAVSGGGLTVIANAPNPAGAGILQSSAAFAGDGINPGKLFLGALFPTAVAIAFFWLI